MGHFTVLDSGVLWYIFNICIGGNTLYCFVASYGHHFGIYDYSKSSLKYVFFSENVYFALSLLAPVNNAITGDLILLLVKW